MFRSIYDYLLLMMYNIQALLVGIGLPVIGPFVCCYFAWQLWRFHICPLLHPQDPKPLPYWIPFVGHALAFFKNGYTLLAEADRHFKGSKETFAITLMGNTMYVVVGSLQASEIDKKFTRNTFEVFERRFMASCGASNEVLEKLFSSLNPEAIPESGNDGSINVSKSLNRLTHDLHIAQLSPRGSHLKNFVGVAKRFLELDLNFEHIIRQRYVTAKTKNTIDMGLMPLVSEFILDSTQRMLFGNEISAFNPELIWTFLELDNRIWQLMLDVPRIAAPRTYELRDAMIASIAEFLALPDNQKGFESHWVKTMVSNMKSMAFTPLEMATVIVPMYIGSNANTRKVCFWMLAYMLYDPDLLEEIRAETSPAIGTDGVVDLEYLKKECPRLNSTWTETLRMSTSAGSFRMVVKNVEICGQHLRRGTPLLIPSRSMHLDKSSWGQDAENFDPDRFLSGKASSRSRNFRPFGGGFNHCPGQYAAQQIAFLLVTVLLHRFDLELIGSNKFPRWGEGDPFPGMMAPKDGDDLAIRLSSRIH